MKKVDIIIPIYNAFEDLQICLESIYKNTDLDTNRLILINDKSPDERIKPFVDKQKRENVIVIHNDSNRGFSNNINTGMAQSEENDVILLNSDTIVTEKWVEKMLECAYSSPEIGTVTPLSNNATLCSVPEFCEENKLPERMTVEQAARIVEECSLKKYPRITVAHGFCMLVKREVIDCIGNFDAETFGRGYGEENDFCNRAELAGYIHVMCDNTYIYHSGTKSFVSKEKEAYILAHDKILRERYPIQMHNNDVHVSVNPNHFVGDNVGIYFDINNGKKNILYLLQSDFREGAQDNRGGTQLHVHDLVKGFRNEANVFVAARDGAFLNLTIYYGKKEKFFRFYIGNQDVYYKFTDRTLNRIWHEIFSAFRIDIVHVHHVISTSFDIFYVAKEYNIPVIFTAHDFYFVCPTVKLLDYNDELCIERCEPDCRKCLKYKCNISDKVDFITVWRRKCREVLGIVCRVIVPDSSAAKVILRYYPDIKDKIQVIPHGYGAEEAEQMINECSTDLIYNIEKVIRTGFTYKVEGWAYLSANKGSAGTRTYLSITNSSAKTIEVPTMPRSRGDVINDKNGDMVGFECIIPVYMLDGEALEIKVIIRKGEKNIYSGSSYMTPKLARGHASKMNIAFIGGFNKAKGGEEIARIIKSVKEDVNWYVFGTIGVESLRTLEQDNLVKAGSYLPESISELLQINKVDVVGILSIWPETYSYTVTEAINSNIPVIVSNIGALGRRVQEDGFGWLVEPDNIQKDFVKIVKVLMTDSSELNKKAEIASSIKIPDIAEMCDSYRKLYDSLDIGNARYDKADYEFILDALGDGNGMPSGQVQYAQVAVSTNAEKELEHIKSTKAYKIMEKMWKIHFPGKSKVEKMAGKILK